MKTLKDIVAEREPQYISNEWIAGVAGCPSTYTYLKEYLYDNNDCDYFENCYDCWNREVEEMHHERNDNQICIKKIPKKIDIVERLRICNKVRNCTDCNLKLYGICEGIIEIIKDAIYEIERLRTENENLYSENWSLQVDLDYMKDEGKQI